MKFDVDEVFDYPMWKFYDSPTFKTKDLKTKHYSNNIDWQCSFITKMWPLINVYFNDKRFQIGINYNA